MRRLGRACLTADRELEFLDHLRGEDGAGAVGEHRHLVADRAETGLFGRQQPSAQPMLMPQTNQGAVAQFDDDPVRRAQRVAVGDAVGQAQHGRGDRRQAVGVPPTRSDDIAMSRPSDDTAIAARAPGVPCAKRVTSQLKFCASTLVRAAGSRCCQEAVFSGAGVLDRWDGRIRISPAFKALTAEHSDLDTVVWRGQSRALTMPRSSREAPSGSCLEVGHREPGAGTGRRSPQT